MKDQADINAAITRHRCWLIAQSVFLLIGFVLILFLWNRSASVSESGSEVLATALTAVEVLLAVFALFLGVGALGGFWLLRAVVIEAARDEARKRLDVIGPELLRETGRVTGSKGERQNAAVGDLDEETIISSAEEVTEDNENANN